MKKKSKYEIFLYKSGWLLVNTFILYHWLDISHVHASLIGSTNSMEVVNSIVQPL